MPLKESDKQKVEERTSLFLKLAQAVFRNYEAWYSEEPLSSPVPMQVPRVIFAADTYYLTSYENAPTPQFVLNNHMDEILSYETTVAYVNQCKSHGLFGAISEDANFVKQAVVKTSISGAITTPLAFIITQHQSFHPTNEQIEETYRWFDQAIYLRYGECYLLILVKNLAATGTEGAIKVGDATLSKFSVDEKNHLSLRMPQLGMSGSGKTPYIISKANIRVSLGYEGYIEDNETQGYRIKIESKGRTRRNHQERRDNVCV